MAQGLRYTFLFALTVSLSVFRFSAQTSLHNTFKYSSEKLLADVQIFNSALVKLHPGLFWYQTQNNYDQLIDKVRKSCKDSLTEAQFYNLLTTVLADTKCGHTDVDRSDKFYKQYYEKALVIPLKVHISNATLFCVNTASNASAIQRGSSIKEINGIKADSILKLLLTAQWTDGNIPSYNRIEFFFPLLLAEILHYPESYKLTYSASQKTEQQINLSGISAKNYEELFSTVDAAYQPYSFATYDSVAAAVLTIRSFSGKAYYKFLKQSFNTVEKKNYKTVIIDVRGNSGGDGYYPIELFKHLAQAPFKSIKAASMCLESESDTLFKYGKLPYNGGFGFKSFIKHQRIKQNDGRYALKPGALKEMQQNGIRGYKHPFTGNVIVLTDIKSYSAASDFAALVRYNKRGLLIGRETGGAYGGNTSGWEFLLTLPNSGLKICIPLIKFESFCDEKCDRGLLPDIEITESVDEMLKVKDPIMNRSLQEAAKNK